MILELARKDGIEISEGSFIPEELAEADEVFVTNSLIEVVPVSRIDGRAISGAPGPITRRLAGLYGGLTAAF
jgi:branched-subunit amino acid aminotransferase/4-amino-4-deoxychorismate lyase